MKNILVQWKITNLLTIFVWCKAALRALYEKFSDNLKRLLLFSSHSCRIDWPQRAINALYIPRLELLCIVGCQSCYFAIILQTLYSVIGQHRPYFTIHASAIDFITNMPRPPVISQCQSGTCFCLQIEPETSSEFKNKRECLRFDWYFIFLVLSWILHY